jgi:TatA/E family protein of Tat protein translocase
MMFRTPGTGEIILIIVALLLLFGAKRIPDLARSVGQALHMFRKGMKEGLSDSENGEDDSGNGEDSNGNS